jgi:hypothetical protein
VNYFTGATDFVLDASPQLARNFPQKFPSAILGKHNISDADCNFSGSGKSWPSC